MLLAENSWAYNCQTLIFFIRCERVRRSVGTRPSWYFCLPICFLVEEGKKSNSVCSPLHRTVLSNRTLFLATHANLRRNFKRLMVFQIVAKNQVHLFWVKLSTRLRARRIYLPFTTNGNVWMRKKIVFGFSPLPQKFDFIEQRALFCLIPLFCFRQTQRTCCNCSSKICLI